MHSLYKNVFLKIVAFKYSTIKRIIIGDDSISFG